MDVCPELLILAWTDVAEIAVAPFGIVKIVDVIGDSSNPHRRRFAPNPHDVNCGP